jgi:hypothetical protein
MQIYALGATVTVPHRLASLFPIATFGVSLLAFVAGSSREALAISSSSGCTALNGIVTASGTANLFGTGFAAGDTITVTFIVSAGGLVRIADNTIASLVAGPSASTIQYIIPSSTADQYVAGISATVTGTDTATVSCTPAASSSNTDSQKLQALQILVSKLVATSSGAAITSAIDGAISDAFSNGGNLVTAGPNGMTFNFAAEPKSQVANRTDEAFSALGYAGNPTKAPPRISLDREWSAWADVHGTGWNSNQTSSGLNGNQVNVTAGIGRKLTPDFLVGVVAGYENFKYDVAALTGTMKGDGGTIGGYAAWRILPTLR